MKIGAEKRGTLIVAGVLMALGLFLFIRMLHGWTSVSASVPVPKKPVASDFEQATAQPLPAQFTKARNRVAAPFQPTLDPRLRLSLLAQSEGVEYAGSGRNIFRAEAEPVIPNPIAPGRKEPPPQPVVQTPPPPPPIPLKFFGFANSPGEPKQVFLVQGDDVFIAREGDIVNRRYKVVRIGNNSVEIEDMLSNSRQTIPLTQS